MEKYYSATNNDIRQGVPSEQSISTIANTGNKHDFDGLNKLNGMSGFTGMMDGINGYAQGNKWKKNTITNTNTCSADQTPFSNFPHFNKQDDNYFHSHASVNSIGTNPYVNQNATDSYINVAHNMSHSNQSVQREFYSTTSPPMSYDSIYPNMEAANNLSRYGRENSNILQNPNSAENISNIRNTGDIANIGSIKNIGNIGNLRMNTIPGRANGTNGMNVNESTTQLIPIMNTTINKNSAGTHSRNDFNMGENHYINSQNMKAFNMGSHNMTNHFMKQERESNNMRGSSNRNVSINNMSNGGMGMEIQQRLNPSNSFVLNNLNSQHELSQTNTGEFLNATEMSLDKMRYLQSTEPYGTDMLHMEQYRVNGLEKRKKKEGNASDLRSAVYEAVIKAHLKEEEIPLRSDHNENEIVIKERNPFYVAICLDKLDEMVYPCSDINKVKYTVNAYFNAYDDIINKYQSKCYKCYPNSTQTHVFCDLAHEIIVLPHNNEPYIYLKVSEVSEYKTETIGRLQLKVKELPQELPLRIAIKGDDGIHKGYVLMYFFHTSYTTDENAVSSKYKKKNVDAPQRTTIRRKGVGFHFFENFTRWCCDIPYDPMN